MSFGKRIELFFKGVLSFIIQIFFKKQIRPPTPPYNRILFIRFDVLGDMIISLPVLRASRMNQPDSRIDIICSFRNNSIVQPSGYVNNTYITTKNPFRNIQLIFQLRKKNYDLVVNLVTRPSLTYGIIAGFIGPNAIRVASDQKNYEYFYTHIITLPPKSNIHITRRLLLLCSFLIDQKFDALSQPWVVFSNDIKEKAKELYQWILKQFKLNSESSKIVAVNLSAGLVRRDWTFKKFLEFLKIVVDKYDGIDGWVIFTNPVNPSESKRMVELVANYKVISLPEIKDFKVLFEFLHYLYALVTPDTSFMHAASATGTPELGLMAEEKVPEWGPLSSPHTVVESKDPLSLKEIPVEDVAIGFDKLLKQLQA